MNELKVFEFEGHNVRSVMLDGEPWWVAADVCRVLEIGNPSDAVRRLDADEKKLVRNIDGLDNVEGGDINNLADGRGNTSATIINESGLYSLILTSRKPASKRFKRWVTSEVLPSIRKTGSFGAAPGLADLAASLATLAAAVASLKLQFEATTPATIAKSLEFGPQVIDADLITVAELVDNLKLPKGTNRLSVSQQLKSRLLEFCAKHTVRHQLSRRVWRFSSVHCGEEARRILPDLLEGARQCDIRKALRKAMEDAATAKRQMDLPGVKLHSVRTDKPAKPPGAA